jgi:lysophospholipase L1-like esterase
MLGSNDFQSLHAHVAWHSGEGLAALVQAIRGAPIEPGMPVPQVLVVAPPAIRAPRGAIAPKFVGGDRKSEGLAEALRAVAEAHACAFFDAGSLVSASLVDGVHLDADAHELLGRELAARVEPLLTAHRPPRHGAARPA